MLTNKTRKDSSDEGRKEGILTPKEAIQPNEQPRDASARQPSISHENGLSSIRTPEKQPTRTSPLFQMKNTSTITRKNTDKSSSLKKLVMSRMAHSCRDKDIR